MLPICMCRGGLSYTTFTEAQTDALHALEILLSAIPHSLHTLHCVGMYCQGLLQTSEFLLSSRVHAACSLRIFAGPIIIVHH